MTPDPRPSSFLPMFRAALLLAASALAAAPAAPNPAAAAFLEKHCVECHDGEVKKGGLDLTTLAFRPEDRQSSKVWQRMIERVREGEMPPSKKPRPPASDAARFVADVHAPLLAADRADVARNGRVHVRRLTRAEYEFAVHDLLGIDIPLDEFLPEDPATHGFQTVADGQQLSHHQLGRSAARGGVERLDLGPVSPRPQGQQAMGIPGADDPQGL